MVENDSSFGLCEKAHAEYEEVIASVTPKREALTQARGRVWRVIGLPPVPRLLGAPVYVVYIIGASLMGLGVITFVTNFAAMFCGAILGIAALWFADKYISLPFTK